jgi:hypothetical protein
VTSDPRGVKVRALPGAVLSSNELPAEKKRGTVQGSQHIALEKFAQRR